MCRDVAGGAAPISCIPLFLLVPFGLSLLNNASGTQGETHWLDLQRICNSLRTLFIIFVFVYLKRVVKLPHRLTFPPNLTP